jgi:hypothetical protein
MTPPRICPPPPDCPLYAQRLDHSQDEPLRRAVLTERRGPDLAALVRAEADRPRPSAPTPPPTRPALPPPAEPLTILDHLTQKGAKS